MGRWERWYSRTLAVLAAAVIGVHLVLVAGCWEPVPVTVAEQLPASTSRVVVIRLDDMGSDVDYCPKVRVNETAGDGHRFERCERIEGEGCVCEFVDVETMRRALEDLP